MHQHHRPRPGASQCALPLLTLCAALAAPLSAQAQVTLDVIGPHEYDLPVGFEPFNVFVQYATFQDGARVWDARGDDKRAAAKTRTIVGL